MTTPFETRCEILTDFWINWKNEKGFAAFVEYNNVGLPLAFILHNGYAQEMSSGITEEIVDNTWFMLLESLGLEDNGFENLQEMLMLAK